jgi:hypothetical protein
MESCKALHLLLAFAQMKSQKGGNEHQKSGHSTCRAQISKARSPPSTSIATATALLGKCAAAGV